MMVDITVGQVSGIIALGITIVQLSLPIAIILILVGILKNENTVATWTTASRAIQSSFWPTFLQLNVPTSRRLDKKVEFLTYLTPISLLLIAIAGIVTPLGLYDEIVPDSNPSQVRFSSVKDDSAFGYGTPPRSKLGFSRVCGSPDAEVCPYTDTILVDNGSEVVAPYSYDTKIPQSLTDTFASDSDSQIAGLWDIEWRQYTETKDDGMNNGSAYLRGFHRHLRTLLLDDTVAPVEGLVVDTREGGIAFRSHSAPTGLSNGATWSEDLLFIQPVTECVDTNLTIDFELSQFISNVIVDKNSSQLTDRGGFVNLKKDYPRYDHDNAQNNPDLRNRAYQAAWLNNVNTMFYWEVTSNNGSQEIDSEERKGYKLPDDTLSAILQDSVKATTRWGDYLQLDLNSTFVNGVNSRNFSDISILCSGVGQSDAANISNIAVNCGLVYGAPQPAEGPASLIFNAGSKWTTPIYSCASAVRATVRTFDFKVNGSSADIKSLYITGSHASSKDHLWAVEKTAYTVSDLTPLWGIVPSANTKVPTSTVKSQSLWLPGYAGNAIGTELYNKQNLAGVDFYRQALAAAYSIDPSKDTGSTTRRLADYSGARDLAMYARWQNLTANAQDTAKMLNLIWTDFAANGVTGTKGVVSANSANAGGGSNTAALGVHAFHRRIRYKYVYAIPAAIVLVLWIIILLLATGCCASRRSTKGKLQHLINNTSTGNVVSSFLVDGYRPEDNAKQNMVKFGDAVIGLRQRKGVSSDDKNTAYAPLQQEAKAERKTDGQEIREVQQETPRNEPLLDSKAWYRVR